MIHYKSKAEIELMRASSLLVCDALALVAAAIKPGVTTLQLDKIAAEFINDLKVIMDFHLPVAFLLMMLLFMVFQQQEHWLVVMLFQLMLAFLKMDFTATVHILLELGKYLMRSGN
jgi:hypothetical protein